MDYIVQADTGIFYTIIPDLFPEKPIESEEQIEQTADETKREVNE